MTIWPLLLRKCLLIFFLIARRGPLWGRKAHSRYDQLQESIYSSVIQSRSKDFTHYGRRLHWVIRSIRSNALFHLGFGASVIYLI